MRPFCIDGPLVILLFSSAGGAMKLLDDKVRRHLPAIRRTHNPVDEAQCMIYAKLYTKFTGVTFYVAEGEQRGQDYMLWGFLVAPEFNFPSKFQITAGRLSTSDWLGKEPCLRDENFKPARWGAIERTERALKQPLHGRRRAQPETAAARGLDLPPHDSQK
jgi:hypothetical protein